MFCILLTSNVVLIQIQIDWFFTGTLSGQSSANPATSQKPYLQKKTKNTKIDAVVSFLNFESYFQFYSLQPIS